MNDPYTSSKRTQKLGKELPTGRDVMRHHDSYQNMCNSIYPAQTPLNLDSQKLLHTQHSMYRAIITKSTRTFSTSTRIYSSYKPMNSQNTDAVAGTKQATSDAAKELNAKAGSEVCYL